ncbi:Endoplasmic reticulum junction formation protein lunapark [Sergentomyia squamirostris]
MGMIISKFRKKESSFQVLEKLEKKISEIENYSIETQKRQKRYIGNFIVASFGVFIICFGVFYFFFFPPTWSDRILYSWPLLCFPIIIFAVRRILNWYFDRKLNQKSDELFSLRDKKRQTLENVMNNEPYKVALQILDRFNDKSITSKIMKSPVVTPASPSEQDNRVVVRQQVSAPQVRNLNYQSPYRPQLPVTPNTPRRMHQQTPYRGTPPAARATATLQQTTTPGRQLPFPLIDWRERNVVERMVDYLIGDGPSSRYAMVCQHCFRHNGMALQEEFEYSNFVCAYCNKLNPARKLRPSLAGLNGGSATLRPEAARTTEKTESSEETPSIPSSDTDSEDNHTTKKSESDREGEKLQGSEVAAEIGGPSGDVHVETDAIKKEPEAKKND